MNRFAHVHERVSTKSFAVLIKGNPKSYHLGAQGTFKRVNPPIMVVVFTFTRVNRVRIQENTCSSDSRFRRELSGTTGHRLLLSQRRRRQMLCVAAWIWVCLTTEFVDRNLIVFPLSRLLSAMEASHLPDVLSCVHIHTGLSCATFSVVKCLWEVFVWGFGVLFLSCACVSVSGVLFAVGVCVCVSC